MISRDLSLVNKTMPVFTYEPKANLKKEMAYLADKGYTPISLYQLRDYLLSKDPQLLPAKRVVITFDDGSSDWFEIVFPTLAAHNFKATFFLITDDDSRRKYLSDSTPLAWNQILQMAGHRTNAAANLFDFESHTHPQEFIGCLN